MKKACAPGWNKGKTCIYVTKSNMGYGNAVLKSFKEMHIIYMKQYVSEASWNDIVMTDWER